MALDSSTTIRATCSLYSGAKDRRILDIYTLSSEKNPSGFPIRKIRGPSERCRRAGLRLRLRVMSARILASDRFCCAGGKGRRVGDPAADDAHGSQELDPVGVDVGLGGGGRSGR